MNKYIGRTKTDQQSGYPRPKSHEISLENLPILKIHNEDMKLIVDAILSRSQKEI